jgi:hypothetical protein
MTLAVWGTPTGLQDSREGRVDRILRFLLFPFSIFSLLRNFFFSVAYMLSHAIALVLQSFPKSSPPSTGCSRQLVTLTCPGIDHGPGVRWHNIHHGNRTRKPG